ncbi:20806_t:CDS:2, partial [Gigaspora margarita]
DYQADRAKRFASAFANNLSYEDLLQWATYMKSEDAHLRSMGEQKILIVWNAFFPTDKSLPSQLWDILKLGKNTIQPNSSQLLTSFYSPQPLPSTHSSARPPQLSSQPSSSHSSAHPPQLSSQPSSSHSSAHPPQLSSQPSSSVRPSRRVKPISMGKRLQDLILPKTALQTNCPEEEIKFFEKIAENKMANFSLDLWVKNVFSAIPRQQHYAH